MTGATMRVSVAGMTCSGCEETLQRALSRVEGVSDVRADYRSGSVEVAFTASPSPEAVVRAVEDAGYDVEGIEDPAQG